MLEFLDDYDWECAFGGAMHNSTEVCPPGVGVSEEPFSREDVEHIICAVNGENDGDEWLGVFLLKDGRYVVVEAGCDYTGWD